MTHLVASVRRRRDAVQVRLGATPTRVLPSGAKIYRGVAAFGDVVLEYPEDGVNEFAPAREVLSPEAVESTIGAVFTIIHPDEMLSADDEDYLRQHAAGTVLHAEPNWQADPPELVVDVVVHTASAQEAVESGRVTDLSLGYDRDPVQQVGEHKGRPYQIVQKNRRSNHLSGVRTARSTAPDGRRARLDEADATPSTIRRDETLAPGEVVARLEIEFGDGIAWARTGEQSGTVAPPPPSWLEALAQARHHLVGADDLGDLPPVPRSDAKSGARAGAHYARSKMEDDILTPPAPARKDADAPPPPAADPKSDAPEAEPAAALGEVAALAALAPEDAEILKTLSAEGQAVLVAALKGLQAEKAEQAIMAAPVAVEEDVEDASTPAAPQSLTADAVQGMIADAIAKAMSGAKKDAAVRPIVDNSRLPGSRPVASPAVVRPVGAIDLDDSAVRKHVTDAQRADESFVAAARKDGHVRTETATPKEAAQAMHAVIVAHLPKLADSAKADLAAGRRDSFLRVYEAAEDVRRSALLDDAASIFAEFARGSVADDATTADALSIFSRSGGSAA